MARYVHGKSRRAEKAFISVNCAAIPENLLESELFGTRRAPSPARPPAASASSRKADGGTLLLDEISEMDAGLQAKLLRALQEREIDRVGGGKPVKVDIRIIATSNRDLVQAVRDGVFREDLLYRLNVVNLKLPALRERPEDILALAQYFAKKYAAANGVPERPIGQAARSRLLSHPGPATCASWRTPCTARCCSPPARKWTPRRSGCPTAPRSAAPRSRRRPGAPRRWRKRSRAPSSAAPSPTWSSS
jgi:transcriptional regulator with PAS, ATPase and Fis domain